MEVVILTKEAEIQIRSRLTAHPAYQGPWTYEKEAITKALALLVPTEVPESDRALVDKIREMVGTARFDARGYPHGIDYKVKLTTAQAAALIHEAKRVPRAMLEEVAKHARRQERRDALGISGEEIPFDAIAAKHGREIGG